MAIILPWVAHEEGGRALERLVESVSGEILWRVRYLAMKDGTWPDGHRGDRIHEVDMAVELVMRSGVRLILSWAMDGFAEGVAVDLRLADESEPDLAGDLIDVSRNEEWARFVGQPLTVLVPVWHIPNDGCPKMPWSFRLEFDTLGGVVIALGEAVGEAVKYQPDALLVIFGEELSKSYRIPASVNSAWGR